MTKDIVVFGSSSSRIFSLIDNVKNVAFKGKSISGLIKKEDNDRKKIINMVKNQKKAKCFIFFFGEVDLHFVFFYQIMTQNKILDFDLLIKKYVEFIDKIKTDSKKIIIVPNNTPWTNVIKGLKNYGYLSGKIEEQLSEKIKDKYFNIETVKLNHKKITKSFMKYTKNTNIILINLEDRLLTPSGKIKKKYLSPVNPNSVHLRWEPLIVDIYDKFRLCGIDKTNIKTNKKKEKEWLEWKKEKLRKILEERDNKI